MPAKPGFMERFRTMTCLRLVDVEDGHAVDGRRLVVAGRRVDHVVGADDQRHVGVLELAVDLLHLLEPVVGDVGLGQQHVHVAGHAAGHRVDGVDHRAAVLLDQLGQLADLRAAPGPPPCRSRAPRSPGGRRPAGWRRPPAVMERTGRRGGALRRAAAEAAPKAPKRTLAKERFIAFDITSERMKPRGAVERAGDDQHVVADGEAGGRGGQAGVGVEQRDHHRHVGATDGEHQRDAEERAPARPWRRRRPGWRDRPPARRRAPPPRRT